MYLSNYWQMFLFTHEVKLKFKKVQMENVRVQGKAFLFFFNGFCCFCLIMYQWKQNKKTIRATTCGEQPDSEWAVLLRSSRILDSSYVHVLSVRGFKAPWWPAWAPSWDRRWWRHRNSESPPTTPPSLVIPAEGEIESCFILLCWKRKSWLLTIQIML